LAEGFKKGVKQELRSLNSQRKRHFAGDDTKNLRLIRLMYKYTQDTR